MMRAHLLSRSCVVSNVPAFIPSLARSLAPSSFTPSSFTPSIITRPMVSSTRPNCVPRHAPVSSLNTTPENAPTVTSSSVPPLSTDQAASNNGVHKPLYEDDDPDAEEVYQLPPPEIARLVDAPSDPSVSLQPQVKECMVLLERPALPPISEVASEELRLAGFRINATTYVPSRADYYIGMAMQRLDDPERRRLPITGLPHASPSTDLHFGYVRWSPDGQRLAFCLYNPLFGLELWALDVASLHAENILPGQRLNAVCGDPFAWSSDSNTIVAKFVIEDRPIPEKPSVPKGPVIQENTSSQPAPSRTFQDLLQTRYDKKLFEHYTTCRLGIVNIDQKKVTYIDSNPSGHAYRRASPSPNGKYILIDIMVQPFAYMMPASRFPRKIQVWELATGKFVTNVADIPLQDKIPIAFDGVGEGPRGIGWRSDSNATLYWAEAQDGGDPNKPADIRDCIFTLPAPFKGSPRKLASLPWRYGGIVWGTDSVALMSERRYKTRSAKSYLLAPGPANDSADDYENNYDSSNEEFVQGPCCERACDISKAEAPKRLIFDVPNWEDRYNDPGSVCTTRDKRGKTVLRLIYPNARKVDEAGDQTDQDENLFKIGRPFFLLQGAGASDEGDRPFLSLFDTVTEKSTMLWRSGPPNFQSIVMVLEEDEKSAIPLKVLIRQEGQKENPNFFVVDMAEESQDAFTNLILAATEKSNLQALEKMEVKDDGNDDGTNKEQKEKNGPANGTTKSGSDNSSEEQVAVGKNNILYPLTDFPHPAPDLIDVQREIVHYERADGVRLNASLYLPPGYDAKVDGKLPVFMWAYPREYKSAEFAGQMKGSPYRFVRLARTPLYWLTRGYAILDGPEMPIIGEGDNEANDTYIEQLVSSAEAAIDFLVERGIADRSKVAIGGHSYGAFMTLNLLAHAPKLFCCGIARSGAYNRTLTPFGFQSEERTLWEARDVYAKMSPYMYADSVEAPVLLVHGDADNNPGTFPLQSERLYQALKGHGKLCRYVNLPHEGHGYRARESVMHVLAEMTTFLDEHCKKSDDQDEMSQL